MEQLKNIKKIDFFKDKDPEVISDTLTGTINKKTTIEFIHYLIDNKKPFSMYLFDFDNFKDINDEFGHAFGDKILSLSVEKVLSLMGDNAILGRFGGDEFLLISFDALSYEEMMNYMRHVYNDGVPYRKIYKNLDITFTIGGVSFPRNAETFEDLSLLMDKCMYRGKKKGRNCFIVYLKEKHGPLIPEKKPISNGNIFEDVYEIIIDPKFRLQTLETYLQMNIDLPKVEIINENEIKSMFISNDVFEKEEYVLFANNIKTSRYMVVKALNEIYMIYPTLVSNIQEENIKAFILFPILSNKKKKEYLIFIDNERKHLWQERDICLANYAAKILSLK